MEDAPFVNVCIQPHGVKEALQRLHTASERAYLCSEGFLESVTQTINIAAEIKLLHAQPHEEGFSDGLNRLLKASESQRCLAFENIQWVGEIEAEAQRFAQTTLVAENALNQLETDSSLTIAHQEREEYHESFYNLFRLLQDAIITINQECLITQFNPGAEVIFGYSANEVLGQHLDILLPLGSGESHRRHIHDFQEDLQDARYMGTRQTISGKRKDNTLFAAEPSICRYCENGQFVFMVVLRDVSERKAREAELEFQAHYDHLCSLPNRAYFNTRLECVQKRALQRGAPLAVIFIDLDGFKFVNDTLGHKAGDELIIAIAKRLEKCVRSGDMVARMSGDEFTVLLEDISGLEDAIQVANRILDGVRKPVNLEGSEIFVSASLGIAYSPDGVETPEYLLRHADTAMYHAKAQGKGSYALFEPSMERLFQERVDIENGLRVALGRGEFRIHYQPLIEVKTGQFAGVEALLRWERPNQSQMLPSQFIPIAEETGLIVPIGYWALEESCRQMEQWRRERPLLNLCTLSVNMSVKQLQRVDIAERVADILKKTGLPACNLQIELTESVLITNLQETIATMKRLKALGVKLALDDFGTGYSSIGILHHIPLDMVKIDRSLISQIEEHHRMLLVVKAIVALCSALSLKVTAEGVETQEQLAIIERLKCDVAQGYLFAKPLTGKEIAEFMDSSAPASIRFLNSASNDMPKVLPRVA